MGHDLTNPRVLLGNTLAFRSIMLLQVAKRTGAFGASEQPDVASPLEEDDASWSKGGSFALGAPMRKSFASCPST